MSDEKVPMPTHDDVWRVVENAPVTIVGPTQRHVEAGEYLGMSENWWGGPEIAEAAFDCSVVTVEFDEAWLRSHGVDPTDREVRRIGLAEAIALRDALTRLRERGIRFDGSHLFTERGFLIGRLHDGEFVTACLSSVDVVRLSLENIVRHLTSEQIVAELGGGT